MLAIPRRPTMILDTCTARPTKPPSRWVETTFRSRYVGAMSVTADQVAAALRTALPNLDGAKLHYLLYYVQGHQLAFHGRPAYAETITAGAEGPYIDGLHDNGELYQPGTVDAQIFDTAMRVARRYGQLTTADLTRLTRAETPWQAARPGAAIEHTDLAAFFASVGADEQPADIPEPTPDELAQLHVEARRLAIADPASHDSG